MSKASVALAVEAVCLVSAGLAAKEKKKNSLPDHVLAARTVAVLIDPHATIPINDPGGNRTAQGDVEKALMNWGRLQLMMDVEHADLVIVLRKGNKQIVQPTVAGEPPNGRPGDVQTTDNGIHVGVQRGQPIEGSRNGKPGPVGPGGEIGPKEDLFEVYQGNKSAPLEERPVWRFAAMDGLKGPDVRAVAEFKKAVDAAVKQQEEEEKKKQQQQTQPQTKP